MARGFLLLDAASLYFRAFYALPDSMRGSDGRPVNAVRGLADFIATLAGRYEPSHLVACWDTDWRPAWRVAAVPSYKAHRLGDGDVPAAADPSDAIIAPVAQWNDDPETPDALQQQVPRILTLLRLAGIPVLGAVAHEADDVIGTLAATAPFPGQVATGDRDLFQVIDDARGVRVLYLTRGVASHAVMDASALQERYGVAPEQYASFATLRGDASDGLPGVAGIGEKTAASLLRQFGDLDGVLAAAEDPAVAMAAGVRAKLRAGAEYARRALPVVEVVRDLPLALDWDDLRLPAGCSGAEWESFVAAVNLGGAAGRLADALAPLRG